MTPMLDDFLEDRQVLYQWDEANGPAYANERQNASCR
jgi:hypothetical protein